jgi:hypothetical protein
MLKCFTENSEYQIFLLKNEQQLSHGGHNRERIMMTPNTFKEFCLKSNTETGRRVRGYYIKMETIMHRLVKEELTKVNEQLDASNDKIKLLEDELLKVVKKPKKVYELGDTVYVVKDCNEPGIYKVGCTNNANVRFTQYFTHGNNMKIVYTKRCKDRKALERAVHVRLSEKKHNDRTDWFTITFDEIRRIIDQLQEVMDGEVSSFTIDDESQSQVCDVVIAQEPPKEQVPKPAFNPVANFKMFFDTCFERDPDAKTAWIDITARYRLWSRCTKDSRQDIAKYLKDNGFTECFLYDEIANMNTQAYKGLQMIPMPNFELPPNPSLVERYMFENSLRYVTARISIKELRESFIEWMQKSTSEYEKITSEHRKALDIYCSRTFLGTTVHTGERIRFGYYGFCLKGNEHIGRKSKDKNRKAILRMDAQTMEVLEEYKSITHAANEMLATIPAISKAISSAYVHAGYRYSFK